MIRLAQRVAASGVLIVIALSGILMPCACAAPVSTPQHPCKVAAPEHDCCSAATSVKPVAECCLTVAAPAPPAASLPGPVAVLDAAFTTSASFVDATPQMDTAVVVAVLVPASPPLVLRI